VATFEITSPDGKRFEVTAPEGATQDQVLAFAQSQFKQPQAEQTPQPAQASPAVDLAMAYARGGPMGLAAPISNLMSQATERAAYKAGGGVTDIATNLGASPEVAAGAGYAANVGVQALPVIAGGALGGMFKPAMQAGAKSLMQSAMKPEKALRGAPADKAATTMLERGINATTGGREKLQTMVSGLETQIDDILKNSTAQVDKNAVGMSLRTAIDKVKTNLSASDDIATIQKSLKEFLNHPLLNNSSSMPVSLANKIKQSIYSTLGPNAFAPGVKVGVERLADKTLARGLREGVARAEPAVVAPMAEQAELLNALKVMGPQALRSGNKNPVGLGALSPSVENALVWMLDRNPWAQSMIARAMYQGSGAIPTATGASLGGLLAPSGQ
jgi:hypothetical protein